MEEEKIEEKFKRNSKEIVIIVLSFLIILGIVVVSIWYFIFKNMDIQYLENMQDFKALVITGIKNREIIEGEALNFINDITVTENEQQQEKNEENKKENKKTKKENKKGNKETKNEIEITTIIDKKETT